MCLEQTHRALEKGGEEHETTHVKQKSRVKRSNASCCVCHCVLLLANDETKHKKYLLSQCAHTFGKNMHAQKSSCEVCAHCVPQFMSDFTRMCLTSLWSAVPNGDVRLYAGMSDLTRLPSTSKGHVNSKFDRADTRERNLNQEVKENPEKNLKWVYW